MLAPAKTCRVIIQAERTAALAADLGDALRALRAYQTDCDNCDLHGTTCQSPGWNTALDSAIRDIAEEWGLI